jgi:hypothetical protein
LDKDLIFLIGLKKKFFSEASIKELPSSISLIRYDVIFDYIATINDEKF